MTQTPHATRESRSMILSMIGNLFMGAAGVGAGIMANSSAILVDGLFSAIGFTWALIGLLVSRRLSRAPDKFRPLGYATEESLFTTFRALTILGLIVFAVATSAQSIHAYLVQGEVSELIFTPVFIYFGVIAVTCLLLWAAHYRNWVKTGRRSDILRLEAKAAIFDGALSGIAGAGLIAIYVYRDGFLAPIAPIGDSLIVLFLCLAALGHFWKDFLTGLGELAGATAQPATISAARRAMRPILATLPGEVQDFTVMKNGRTHLICVYYTPEAAITARAVDELYQQLTKAVHPVLPGSEVLVIISEESRAGFVMPGPDAPATPD